MHVESCLHRISYEGNPRPNLHTLKALHRAHVCHVPFENLDVQLGTKVSTLTKDAYEKIVVNNRGGWCYEQNALFGWLLAEIGFSVTRLSAGVMRKNRGDAANANHLCLKVICEDDVTPYLADVGFGGSLFEPIPFTEAEYYQAPFRLGLKRLDDHYWRFWEDLGRGEFSFDFLEGAANEQSLTDKCEFLQTDPSSEFVLNSVTQLRLPDQHRSLRGRVFSVAKKSGIETVMIESAEHFVQTLSDYFNLELPEAATLWPAITARHDQLQLESTVVHFRDTRKRAL